MTMTQNDAIAIIRSWILAHCNDKACNDITLELDLIDQRVVDSLHFTELILLLEEITEEEIDVSKLHINSLRSIQAMKEHFLVRLPR